jgi:drug/metabolite transporter (DMT)-like permease
VRNFAELLLLSALWGASFLFLRIISPVLGPILLIELRVLIAFLLLAPFVTLQGPERRPSIDIWLCLAGLSIFCTAIAYLLFYRLIARLGAYRTVTVTFLVPVFSLLWGGLFLGERLTGVMLLGSLLVLLGVALATGRLNCSSE